MRLHLEKVKYMHYQLRFHVHFQNETQKRDIILSGVFPTINIIKLIMLIVIKRTENS